MKKFFLLLLIFGELTGVFGQNVKGVVRDEKGDPMTGVTVLIKGTSTGTQTDTAGKYSLPFGNGTHYVDFSFIGYSPRSELVTILDKSDRTLDVQMTDSTKDLDIVVVTGSKYEKKFGEQIVSMEVVKATAIQQNNEKMDEAMNKVPGVNMLGRTISIRGGSGFSDATSNRVMGLQDDVPIISPENGSIIWDMIPIEELEQVEVLKGSSSAVYGSSALDGVLNFVTVEPTPQMENRVILNYGFYGQPDDRDWDYWWKKQIQLKDGKMVEHLALPMFGGGTFLHRKQYGDVGVVLSGSYQQNQNYLQQADYSMARMGAKLRYIPHKHPHLTLGLNSNFFHKDYKDFFAAADADSGAYKPLGGSNPIVRQRTFNIDPYLNYYDNNDNRHSFKFQVFNVLYNSTTGDSTASTKYYYNYTLLHTFKKSDVILTAGTEGFYSLIRGKTFGPVVVNPSEITYFSTRDEMNFAGFAQFEKKFFHKLTLAGGARLEYTQQAGQTIENRLPLINLLSKASGDKNAINSPVTPLCRVGLNYQVSEGTFLRGSFGQGFRYPSMAEKYIFTTRSGAIVFPNDTLRPENGWMAEVGIKQGVKISKWIAYFDASMYITRYHDLIEFEGYKPPDSLAYSRYLTGIPFQAQNIDNARIWGAEFSAVANGKIFGVPLNFLIGYTYVDPQNLDYNKADPAPNSTPLLKYRIQHSAKADAQFNWKGLTAGLTAFYGSFIKYIDNGTLGALQVIEQFRETHDKGEFVMDVRAGYTYKEKASFMFICKNVANTEYMLEPGVIDAPRNYGFQVGYNF
jgi:iron complex outermembrane receptor protein